ncbi:hypothetical protein [Gilvibacter sp.]|uniref:hypothetical protein n=1 Tax=Gilvibacter sp. TaxID=2729997 RepID=UPI0025C40110|nr:hypothetical protein [Gilvibacter sp.]NQX76730.1 hypothetical protein [Gilvibacter sp.]
MNFILSIVLKNLKILALFLVLFVTIASTAQTFTGVVTFDIDFEFEKHFSITNRVNYLTQYGEQALMFYMPTGDTARKYLDANGEPTMYQLYSQKAGELLFVDANGEDIWDRLDTTGNSLELLNFKEVESEVLAGLENSCYEYYSKDIKSGEEVLVYFCASEHAPKLDYRLLSNHVEYYLADFYKMTERPYLKYQLVTNDFTMTFNATKIEEMGVKEMLQLLGLSLD